MSTAPYFGHLLGAQVASQHCPILQTGLLTISEYGKCARVYLLCEYYQHAIYIIKSIN